MSLNREIWNISTQGTGNSKTAELDNMYTCLLSRLGDEARFGRMVDTILQHQVRPEEMTVVVDQMLEFYRRESPLAAFETLMADPEFYNTDRLNCLTKIAIAANGGPTVSTGQLFAFTNNHPVFGCYPSGESVGSKGLFVTPIEQSREYREAYALHVCHAFEALSGEREFSAEDPFTVVIVGDANLRMTRMISERLKKYTNERQTVKIIIVDNSRGVIEKDEELRKIPWDVETVLCDARDIESIRLSGKRGVVIAGEELADDLPCETLVADHGELKQLAWDLDVSVPKEVLIPMSESPYIQQLWDYWVAAFPEYEDIASYLINNEKPPYNRLTLNIGFLELMRGLAHSGFEGYYMGGDYSTFYTDRRLQLEKHHSPAIHANTRRMDNGKMIQVFDLYVAIMSPTNISTDVDFGLLAYALSEGMDVDYLGGPENFNRQAKGIQPRQNADVVRKAEELFLSTNPRRQKVTSGKIKEVTAQMSDLEKDFTWSRTNWILRMGNVPSLFGL